jgi:hypothetical protein
MRRNQFIGGPPAQTFTGGYALTTLRELKAAAVP